MFPLHANSKNRPVLGDGWPDYATSEHDAIVSWWTAPVTAQEREYNIGVLTNGHCVIDLDMKRGENGVASFQTLGGGPHTLTVQSPSGGFHLYYRSPREIAGNQNIMGPGIDVRGYHNFTLAPGSTVDGRAYTLSADAPIAPMPEHFWPYLREPGERRELADRPAATELDTPANVQAAIDYLTRARPAIEGQHGDLRTLNTAMECRDLGVTAAVCLDLMLDHFNDRCEPPWDPDELQVKVENAYNYAENQAGAKSASAVFAGVTQMEPVPFAPAGGTGDAPGVAFRPFQYSTVMHASLFKPRDWVLEHFLERGEITQLIAAGGTGKSQFALTVGVLLAVGAPEIFGFRNIYAGYPMRSIIYNAEDSIAEMSKRISAFCYEAHIVMDAIMPYVSVTSGRDFKLSIATGGRVVERTDDDDMHIGWLVSAAMDPSVAMTSLDPLSKIHTGNPSENRDMNAVADILQFIASRSNSPLLIPAHVSRSGANGGAYAGNVHAQLGAVGMSDSARINYTLSPPTDDDVARYGLSDEDRNRYLRLDGAKVNHSLRSGAPQWIEKRSVKLLTGDIFGSFHAISMRGRNDTVREQMAEVLHAEMISAGTASITLLQAQMALSRCDPVYGQLPPAVVKGRIERFLAAPFELADGTTMSVVLEGNHKLVVFK